jgi:hypothetical protein
MGCDQGRINTDMSFKRLICIAQWWIVRRLYTRAWTAKEVEDLFKQMSENKSKDGGEGSR